MKAPLWLTAVAVLLAGIAAAPGGTEADRHFTERVKPLLDLRCVSCHGAEKQKGNLRLDSRDATLKGGDLGPSVVPNKPALSLLVQAVLHSKPDLEMPPKDKLSTADVEILTRWIEDGAPWPLPRPALEVASPAPPGERIGDAWSDPRNPIVRIFNGQRLDLWSLKPVRRPPVPEAAPATAGRSPGNAVDRFIVARLKADGIPPAPEADRRTLARRVSFDLTGLPPTARELTAFLDDGSPGAYERLVERLLGSPRYGEHQARLWLDVVRYSDSNGFDWDEFRPEAWRFRDYVIRSFNADKPFDLFVREQIAGDEMLDGEPRSAADEDLLVATGYLRIGPQDNSAGLFDEQARARSDWLTDLTETTGSAFLGLSLSCCRCHDHKYDPLSQADHYRLRAFFEPVKHGDDLALDLAPDQEAIRNQRAGIDAQVTPIDGRRKELVESVRKRVRAERIAALPENEQRLLAMTSDPQPQDFKEKARAIEKKIEVSDSDVIKAATEDEKKRHEALTKDIDALNSRKRAFQRGLLATDTTNQVGTTHVLFQGDHKATREPVAAGFPSILDPNPAEVRKPVNAQTTGRRLTLAGWIASDANPLTARVFVNRAWQALFGRGLVATPNDFGLAGARPSHPELLDWLASEFIAQGWSLKGLNRLLVSSATYRQTTTAAPAAALERDRENTLYWRQNPRRLSAEQMRDAMLVASGLLETRAGGRPVWPELPEDVLKANPAFLDDNAEKTKGWYPSPPALRQARSVYLVQKRTVRVPFLETFDMPDNSVSCARRTVSIVAPQALSMLNSPDAIQAASGFAARVATEARDRAETVERAFMIALQRHPTSEEARACQRFLAGATIPELCRALLNLNEFAFVD